MNQTRSWNPSSMVSGLRNTWIFLDKITACCHRRVWQGLAGHGYGRARVLLREWEDSHQCLFNQPGCCSGGALWGGRIWSYTVGDCENGGSSQPWHNRKLPHADTERNMPLLLWSGEGLEDQYHPRDTADCKVSSSRQLRSSWRLSHLLPGRCFSSWDISPTDARTSPHLSTPQP